MPNASTKNRIRFANFWLRAVVLACAATCVQSGCNRSSTGALSGETAKSTAAATVSGPTAKSVDLENPVLRIDTIAGTITVRLNGSRAPGTVRNFLNYASEGFYDNTLVHYVSSGKMIVAGGYSADRKAKPTRPPIRNEAHNGLKMCVARSRWPEMSRLSMVLPRSFF